MNQGVNKGREVCVHSKTNKVGVLVANYSHDPTLQKYGFYLSIKYQLLT